MSHPGLDGGPGKYPQGSRDRAIRLAKESDRPFAHISKDLGCIQRRCVTGVRQDEADRGERAEQRSTAERDELKRLRGSARSCVRPTKS